MRQRAGDQCRGPRRQQPADHGARAAAVIHVEVSDDSGVLPVEKEAELTDTSGGAWRSCPGSRTGGGRCGAAVGERRCGSRWPGPGPGREAGDGRARRHPGPRGRAAAHRQAGHRGATGRAPAPARSRRPPPRPAGRAGDGTAGGRCGRGMPGAQWRPVRPVRPRRRRHRAHPHRIAVGRLRRAARHRQRPVARRPPPPRPTPLGRRRGRLARDDRLSRAYGTLADGRLVRSWIIAPVPDGDGNLAGILYLGHPRPHAFDAEAESQAAGLARHLGAAIAHAEVAAERDRVASALEATLLPPVSSASPASTSRPVPGCGPERRGRDFYDAFPLAAAGGRSSSATCRAAVPTPPPSPASPATASGPSPPTCPVLPRSSTASTRPSSARTSTTVSSPPCWPASPRPDRVQVLLAGGGHPPALVLHDDESVTVLDSAPGMLLGMLPGGDCRDVPVTLHAGDALVLYTDGVVEGRGTPAVSSSARTASSTCCRLAPAAAPTASPAASSWPPSPTAPTCPTTWRSSSFGRRVSRAPPRLRHLPPAACRRPLLFRRPRLAALGRSADQSAV